MNITVDRAVIEQALVALENAEDQLAKPYSTDASKAIAALRTALEQPVQEPVAWMDREGDLYKMPEIKGWAPPHTMLYTTPPQRKPLTDEQMNELSHTMVKGDKSVNWLCRAIEAAHGIKDKS